MPRNTPVNTQLSSSYPLAPSSLESIDYALYDFVDKELNIFCDSNQGFEKVPVIFSTPERAFQIKNNPDLRTEGGRTLVYPLISVKRTSMTRNPTNKGRFGVYVPPYFDFYKKGGSIEIARMVQQEKTQKFANSNAIRRSPGGTDINYQTFPKQNKNIVYETVTIPMPTFVEVSFEINLFSEYQQQMNQMVEVFTTYGSVPSSFDIKHDGNSYKAKVNPDFSVNNTTELGTSERRFQTTVSTMVLGYLVGAGKNQKTPNVVIRESAAKIRLNRARSIVGDIPEFHVDSKDKYRP